MTRLAVCSVAHGLIWKRIAEVTFKSIGDYAKRIGAAFVPLPDTCPGPHTHWEKMKVGKLLWDFDRVAWIDGDCIVNPTAESLFDVVPPGVFGAMDEAAIGFDRHTEYEWAKKVHGLDIPHPKRYFNAGVMVFDREHIRAFLPPADRQESPLGTGEQAWMNAMTYTLGFHFQNLPMEFNAFYGIFAPPDRVPKAKIMHYAGHGKGSQEVEKLMAMMREVQAVWEAKKQP